MYLRGYRDALRECRLGTSSLHSPSASLQLATTFQKGLNIHMEPLLQQAGS